MCTTYTGCDSIFHRPCFQPYLKRIQSDSIIEVFSLGAQPVIAAPVAMIPPVHTLRKSHYISSLSMLSKKSIGDVNVLTSLAGACIFLNPAQLSVIFPPPFITFNLNTISPGIWS